LSVGLIGNAAEVLPKLVELGVTPDVVTDQTAAHDLRYGYVPIGWAVDEAAALRASDPDRLEQLALDSIAAHVQALLTFQERGSVVFEYGNNLRAQAARRGLQAALDKIPIFTREYIRPLFCQGIGPFRWLAISGEPSDIARLDQLVLDTFPDNHLVSNWIRAARGNVPFEGLPARIAWLGHGERARLGVLVNQLVARGELHGPIAFTRDHLDAGAVAQPYRETEGMLDGSDAISDWPLLNALLTCAAGADLVAIHGGGIGYTGFRQSAGMTIVADGSPSAERRLERALTVDTGIGVVRYADAGYQLAADTAARTGIWRCDPAGEFGPPTRPRGLRHLPPRVRSSALKRSASQDTGPRSDT
jgi:urocanate hydratase